MEGGGGRSVLDFLNFLYFHHLDERCSRKGKIHLWLGHNSSSSRAKYIYRSVIIVLVVGQNTFIARS